MSPITDRTALIIVDVQEGLDDPRLGPRNNPGAEASIARLLAHWRAHARPIYHIQHMSTEPDSPLRPERPGNAIKAIAAPQAGEPLLRKSVHSAFIGTDLHERLQSAGIQSLVIAGLTTNHCVSTTVRMACDLGYAAVVVADATACHAATGYDGTRYDADTLHALALASLNGEFATVLTTDQVIAI